MSFGSEASLGTPELERPDKVVGLFKVLAASMQLVDQILHADDVLFAEGALDDSIVGQGNPLFIDFPESSGIHQIADGLFTGIPVSDIRLHPSQHVDGGFIQFYQNCVVQLPQSQ